VNGVETAPSPIVPMIRAPSKVTLSTCPLSTSALNSE